jgi:uncharacterized Rmd1/YagE family protein
LDEPQQPKEEFTSPHLPPNTHKRKRKRIINIKNSKIIILKKPPQKKEKRKPTRNKKDKFKNSKIILKTRQK